MLGHDHSVAADSVGDRRKKPLGLGADRIRQAALDRIGIARALFGNAVAVISLLDMTCVHKLAEAVGIIEISDAVIALAQIKQRLRIDYAGQAAQDKKNKYLYIELFMYKPKSAHIVLLRFFQFYYFIIILNFFQGLNHTTEGQVHTLY